MDEVADATVRCLFEPSPPPFPELRSCRAANPLNWPRTRLNAMNVRFKSRLPWALAFSFARAIQQPALEIWQGEEAHVLAAQQALYHRARCNRAARRGEYNAAMDKGHEHDNKYPATRETCGIAKTEEYPLSPRAVRYSPAFELVTKVSRRCIEGIWQELERWLPRKVPEKMRRP